MGVVKQEAIICKGPQTNFPYVGNVTESQMLALEGALILS